MVVTGFGLRRRIERLPKVVKKTMLGYEFCSANKKLFTGFSKKDGRTVIAKLPKQVQEEAVKEQGIHRLNVASKNGWIKLGANRSVLIKHTRGSSPTSMV